MSDARAILALYDHARAHDLPVVLATVLATSGSTYRKPGARMMICADGTRVGVVSGGCLEADVARRAWFLKAPGQRECVRYDTGSGEDAVYEFGLGCRGVVDVMVERLDLSAEPAIIRLMRQAVHLREEGVLRIEQHELGTGRTASDSDPAYQETITPPVQLVIFGSGVDTAPLASMGDALGWSVVVIDHKLGSSRVDRDVRYLASQPGSWMPSIRVDARTACVIMTHRLQDDVRYLSDVVKCACGYIGCLGPASRTEALFDELALAGLMLTDADRIRLHAPIGLDLNAERPQEIALAILAEIAAVMNGGTARPLRSRPGPIHLTDTSLTPR